MLRRADKIICTSQAYADASQALMPFAAKVAIVPLGTFDVPPGNANEHACLARLPAVLQHHLASRQVVLAVGRLVPYKGFAVLIEAARLMATDAAVVIVGGGPLEAALRRQIDEAGLGHRVVLAGRVNDETLDALQRLSTVFCLPSIERSEAFGVVLVEAMAHGLPVVATHIPGSGVPWVNQHGETGLNVQPRDAVQMANALDDVLQHPDLRQRLAQGARSRYEKLFTIQRSISETLRLYRDLTG
jgi:glycosyltransferase involved in cell wall biosynthesis